jgi:hypothetical protein
MIAVSRRFSKPRAIRGRKCDFLEKATKEHPLVISWFLVNRGKQWWWRTKKSMRRKVYIPIHAFQHASADVRFRLAPKQSGSWLPGFLFYLHRNSQPPSWRTTSGVFGIIECAMPIFVLCCRAQSRRRPGDMLTIGHKIFREEGRETPCPSQNRILVQFKGTVEW